MPISINIPVENQKIFILNCPEKQSINLFMWKSINVIYMKIIVRHFGVTRWASNQTTLQLEHQKKRTIECALITTHKDC